MTVQPSASSVLRSGARYWKESNWISVEWGDRGLMTKAEVH
jgi:hypothetical protein